MNKNTIQLIATLVAIMVTLTVSGQEVKIAKDANRLTYYQYDYSDGQDTTLVTVLREGNTIQIVTPQPKGRLIEGYASRVTIVDYNADSITVSLSYDDGSIYYYRRSLSRSDIEWRQEGNKHICSINSNTLEFTMDEKAGFNASPLPHYGLAKGVLRQFVRNGQRYLELAKAEKVKGLELAPIYLQNAIRLTPHEMDLMEKERLVISTRLFDNDTVYWGAEKKQFAGGLESLPHNKVLHFAGGTIVAKRMHLPMLGSGYQHFVEIHQRSNGDAYDRTGSVFVIPIGKGQTFFDGMNMHPDSLPTFHGRDGQNYQGMIATRDFRPVTEWVRFFTPFGVGAFNDRVSLPGIEWQEETYYKQEITDVYVGGDVLVCAWIGNYSSGHLLTIDLKSYPTDQVQHEEAQREVIPLFNTCNVLEMAGQNYGKLFASDTLRVTIRIPASAKSARLRYISTGHGGWDDGDEFIPKQNSILIDNRLIYTHTPWRTDCGCYRRWNPVSGNFWNGLSSSDYSRSGWCPGTATQPTYFDLQAYRDGREHELAIAIPQGKPVEGMFSHWAVSGILEIEY